MALIAELRRRNVIRVAAAYVVTAWLIIQVAETIFPLFGFGDAPARYTVILLAIGFALVVVLSWIFEWTPEGLRRESEVERDPEAVQRSGRRLDRAIMVLLAAGLAYFAFDKFVLDPARDAALVEETAQQARSQALVESYGDKSIAVLPFADMSVNRDQEYMSDGIAEELLNLLAKIPELRVVSRSSAFAFKSRDIEIPEIARQLNTSYILEGSVRQAGDQLRITAQLIDARSDTHLWSETYDRRLENIFEIQDEISAEVVAQLKLALLGGAPRSRAIDEEAYMQVLQARYFWNRRAEGDAKRALEHFEKALETSPEYAPAWAGVAWARSVLSLEGEMDREEGLRLAEAAARKAVELDPTLSDAHVRMGQAHARAGNWRASLASYGKALELDPDSPLALGVMALQVWRTGDLAGSIEMFRKIEELDPLSAIWPANRFNVLVRAGRYDEALAANERFFTISGNRPVYDANRAIVFELTGRYEASWELTENAPDQPDPLVGKAILLHHLGRPEEAEAMRRKLEEMNPPESWAYMARIYARWGDFDRAFEQLSAGVASQTPAPFIRHDPHLTSLRDDPRWEEILQRFPDPYAGLGAD